MLVPSARDIAKGTENGTTAVMFPAGFGIEAFAVIVNALGVAVENE